MHILGLKPTGSHPKSRGLVMWRLYKIHPVSRGAALTMQWVVARPVRGFQDIWWEMKGKDAALAALLLSCISHGQCNALVFGQKRAHEVKALC